MKQEQAEIQEQISIIVEWYKELPKDYSNIEDLMYARKQLSTHQFLMAVMLSDLRQKWKESEVGTEIVRRTKAVELIIEGSPMTKVVEISKAESLGMLELEKMADVEYHNMRFIIEATQEVNNTIMQHISQLKIEQRNISHSQT